VGCPRGFFQTFFPQPILIARPLGISEFLNSSKVAISLDYGLYPSADIFSDFDRLVELTKYVGDGHPSESSSAETEGVPSGLSFFIAAHAGPPALSPQSWHTPN
jgi:hypothetical protein